MHSQCHLIRVEGSTSLVALALHHRIALFFQNGQGTPIESSLQLSMRGVYSFEARIGGRLIRSKCLPKNNAADVYDDAISEGKAAVLCSITETGICLELGAIGPNETYSVTLEASTECALDFEGNCDVELPYIPCDNFKWTFSRDLEIETFAKCGLDPIRIKCPPLSLAPKLTQGAFSLAYVPKLHSVVSTPEDEEVIFLVDQSVS